jgi:hypothetical protein
MDQTACLHMRVHTSLCSSGTLLAEILHGPSVDGDPSGRDFTQNLPGLLEWGYSSSF